MSQPIDDGGPAFPAEVYLTPQDTMATKCPGMSLRDWFAGQALAGLMVNYDEHPHTVEVCAEIAYNAADAMLAQRRLTKPE